MENYNQSNEVMSVKDWFITLFITGIPLVGLIMLFVWAFGGGANITKQNYAKGALILVALVAALYFVFFVLFAATLFSTFDGMSS